MKVKSKGKRKFYLRLFSVVFAIFIWLYVVSSAQVEVEKVVPINIEIPEKYANSEKIKKEVTFIIKGPRIFVRNLLDKTKQIHIKSKDYYNKDKRNYKLNLQKYRPNLPLGVELIGFSPKKINLKLEKKLSKTVPIALDLDGESLKDYDVQKIEIKPAQIEISGAKSVVRKIKKIYTSTISMNNLTDGKSLDLKLVSPDERIKLSKDNAVLSYTLASKLTEFTFSKIPIIFHSTKLIKAVIPKTVKIFIRGDKSLVSEATKAKIQVIAEVPASAKSKDVIKLKVKLPDGIEVLNLEPESVSIITE